MRLKRIPAVQPPARRPRITEWPKSGLRLSVVIPYWRKLQEFRHVLPLNAPFLAREDVEVLVCLDEPTQEREVVHLVAGTAGLKATVLVNDEDHPWRAPTKSINVGIRAARGDLILVISPETAFSGDVPSRVISACDAVPGGTVVGRLSFNTIRRDALVRAGLWGNICAPRAVLEEIRGYDESFTKWGGDDVDVRRRIQLAGYAIYSDEDVRVVHLSEKVRAGMSDSRTADPEQMRRGEAERPGGQPRRLGRVVQPNRFSICINW